MLTSSLLALLLIGASPQDQIDTHLGAAQRHAGVQPAPLCDDETFLRRVTLDLAGRIPTRAELTAFRRQPNRTAKIDQLLAGDEFPRFWSQVWTSALVGYATERFEASREPLRIWLEEQLRANTPYDKIARELIAAEGESAFDGPVNFLVRHREQPAVKVSRIFLGVRLDCARCHDHPFDRWTREDFDRFTRFFDGVEYREVSGRNIRVLEAPREASEEDRPRFLSGAKPRTSRWRDELALFVTTCKPFARNYANRVWYQLLGRGVVEPPDDFSANEPSSPELMKHLTELARETKFDTRAMIRAICNSQAYQRQSGRGEESFNSHSLFASFTPKPLTIEQQIHSLRIAFDLSPTALQIQENIRNAVEESLDADFSETWAYRDNVQDEMSRLVRELPRLEGDFEDWYERILSRSPTMRERKLCEGRPQSQVIFALTHSNEFRFNH